MKKIGLLVLMLLVFVFCGCGSKVKMKKASADYVNHLQSEVHTNLLKIGFRDITFVVIDDLDSNSSMADGTVSEVSINGVSDFNKGDTFEKSSGVVITYHSIPKFKIPISVEECQKLSLSEAKNAITESGFVNVNYEEAYDMDPDTFTGDFVDELLLNENSLIDKEAEYVFDIPIRIIRHYPYVKHTVKLHVQCIKNLIFSKYDVDIYLDEEKMYTLPHGSEEDYELRLKEGNHKLLFCNKDSKAVSGEIDLGNVDCDVDLSCKLNLHSDVININITLDDRKYELGENDVKMDCSADSLKLIDYEDVDKQLRALGFTQIIATPIYDIYFGILSHAGEIEKISIAGDSSFIAGKVFGKDDVVEIKYHETYEKDPEYIAEKEKEAKEKTEAEKKAKEEKKAAEEKDDSDKLEDNDEILTKDNNDDVAALLTSEYLNIDDQAEFVEKYYGKTIEFDCTVVQVIKDPKYSYIYSYILVPGDSGKVYGSVQFLIDSVSFPAFHWDRNTQPEYLAYGSNIKLRAKIKKGEDPVFIYLNPVKTWGR